MNDGQPLELEVLDALVRGCDTLSEIAYALSAAPETVDRALRWGCAEGLVLAVSLPDGYHFQLTPHGQYVVGVRQQTAGVVDASGRIDLSRVTQGLGRAWAAAQQGQHEQHQLAAAHTLVDDGEREAAVQSLSAAYAEGRVDHAELERRTQLALLATDRGSLTAALDGVVTPGPAPVLGPVPEMTRWVWLPGGKRITVMVLAGFVVFATLIRILAA